jgi:hypothetical protein
MLVYLQSSWLAGTSYNTFTEVRAAKIVILVTAANPSPFPLELQAFDDFPGR